MRAAAGADRVRRPRVRIGQQLESIGMALTGRWRTRRRATGRNRYVGELIGGIQETTRAQVRQAVAAWVDNGQPLEALIRELEPTFGRACRVDRQHRGHRAYAEGTQAAYREAGVIERMQWRTARDEIVSDLRRAAIMCRRRLGSRSSIRRMGVSISHRLTRLQVLGCAGG